MANYNLNFDYHKIAYNQKWATAININGSRKWNEELTPTRSMDLKTHLPFTDWGNNTNTAVNTNATYDYARNSNWVYGSTAISSHYKNYITGNAKNTSAMLSYLPADNRKSFGLTANAPAESFKTIFEWLLHNLDRPSAKGSYTNGGLGANYTLSFWLYWGATNNRSLNSNFQFLQSGDDGNMKNSSGVRQGASYSGGCIYEQWAHKFEISLNAAQQKLSMWVESRAGNTGWNANMNDRSYFGINIPVSTVPKQTWTKCSVMVSGNNITGMSFARMPGNNNQVLASLKNFSYYTGPWSIGNGKIGSGAKRLSNAPASNRIQQEFVTCTGPDIKVSQFRGYNKAWEPASQTDIHSFQHRNQWGDLPSSWAYPSPPAEQFIQTFDESSLTGQTNIVDTEFANHLRNGLNRNLSDNDSKQWIEEFDASHGTNFSVNLPSASDIADMKHDKLNSLNSMDIRDQEKTKEVTDLL